MRSFRRVFPPLLVAVSLALTSCGEGGDAETEAPTSTTTRTEQVTESADGESEGAGGSGGSGSSDEQYSVVSASTFRKGTAYVVGGDPWLHYCYVKTPEDSENPSVSCTVTFEEPLPPIERGAEIPGVTAPDSIWWDDEHSRFQTDYSPGGQIPDNVYSLREGEQVSIKTLTMTHLHGGGIRLAIGDSAIGMHEGVYTTTDPVDTGAEKPAPATAPEQEEAPKEEAPAEAPAPEAKPRTANYGEVCGSVESSMGGTYQIVALEDGTTCDIAVEVMRGYVNAWTSGGIEGSAGFWTAPNGWGCASGYILPGDEDIRANAKNTCSDSDPAGRPASEGSGSFVALRPEDVGRL